MAAAIGMGALAAGCGVATPPPPPRPRYPLRIAANRRYLEDQAGNPVLVQGDTPWSLVTGLTRLETETYLDDRAAKGFNSLIANLIEHKFNGPRNRYGQLPFLKAGDFSTPNEEYFAHADWVMEQAARRDIQIFLAPIYLGYDNGVNDEGWFNEVLAQGPEACRQYGRFVGQRYGKYDNLIWLIGGDRNPGATREHIDAFVAGLKEYDTGHLFTAHTAPESSPVDRYGKSGWLDLNATYTYGNVQLALMQDYLRDPVIPFVLIEATYENEHNSTAAQIRRQAYYALLCGGCGQFFGNRPIWLFDPGWEAALNGEGSRSMQHMKTFVTSRPWHRLVPDRQHITITDGLGDFLGDDYLAAALADDGSTLLVYMPTPRQITLNLKAIAGRRARVHWFDPRTGKPQEAGTFPISEPLQLTPPGEGDWALVVDNKELNLPAPGQ